MAESPLDRLKRLAAEKKAAVAQPVANAVDVMQAMDKLDEAVADLSKVSAEITGALAASGEAGASVVIDPEVFVENSEANLEARFEIARQTVANKQEEAKGLGNSVTTSEPSGLSSHPLVMDFAELEAALLASDPEFKTILRKIHRHLGQEAELVTQMTEQEIQMVVQGLIVFANAEVVAPAAAKKQVISADDL